MQKNIMNELLSPAGTLDAFYAAISNGADAIYLGLDKYSARAYADNFSLENIGDLLEFAHLRNVKIYVTINTIAYDYELKQIYKTIDKLAELGVDGIIVQDLAVLTYITNHYKSLAAHVSTQMGIDDLDGAKLVKDLGAERIVFARETNINTLKSIKKELGIEIEAFIHGALCVSYSGNCFMSSMMGERSGNRGRCAGCCRKPYTLVDLTNKQIVQNGFLLSMKDLNISPNLKEMNFVDSLKIEGRMKEPTYVGAVTRYYRNILDNNENSVDINKVFNRTYTKGFMFNATSSDITNIERPNNFGYLIGKIERISRGKIWIRLTRKLSKGDQIRIENPHSLEEISIPVLKLYDSSFNVVQTMNKVAVVSCDKKVTIGANVYKTKDVEFNQEIEKTFLQKELKKLDIDMEFLAQIGKPIMLKIQYSSYKSFVKSEFCAEKAISSITTNGNILAQLSKLNDTPYQLRNLNINSDENIFIPLKAINELRREGIAKLNEMRLERKVVLADEKSFIPEQNELNDPILRVEVSNQEQYDACQELGIANIYFKNVIRRNNANYRDINGEVLVGGLGGINHYKDTNYVVSDYSLNVVNYQTTAILSSLGVKRITLSPEIDKEHIAKLLDNYKLIYNTYPNLELIVYGRMKLMHTKYCPLKRLGLCGKCKENRYALKDEFASFPLLFNDDCTINVLNSKKLNLIDDLDSLNGINNYRLVFTDETKDEAKEIIEKFQTKLNGNSSEKEFNSSTDTRGHFYKNPL